MLRLYGLSERGIFDYDEAWYLLEAKSIYDAGQFLIDRILNGGDGTPLGPAIRDHLRERGTVPLTSFKPGHVLLVLTSFLVFGLHDYSAFVFSALFGIGTAILVYFLGCRLGTRREALFAAALLSCSASHIAYSRSSYGQADSIFFVALGVWLWIRSLESDNLKEIFGAGAAMGFAITCHYNTALTPIFVVAVDAVRYWNKRRAFTPLLKRSAVWVSGILAAPICFELPARLAKALGIVPADFLTYLEQFFNRGTAGMAATIHPTLDAFPHVTEHFMATEGLIIIAAGMIGLAVVLGRLRQEPLSGGLVIILGVLPALGWLFAMKGGDIRFRVFPVTFPFLAIIGGIGFAQLAHLGGRIPRAARILVPALILLIAVNGIIRAQPLVKIRSGYSTATDELLNYAGREGGTIGFFPGSSWPIYYFYLSAAYDNLDAGLRSQIDFYRQQNEMESAGDFEPVDAWRYYRGYRIKKGKDLIAHLENVRKEATPVVRVPNPASQMPRHFLEAGGDSSYNCIDRALASPEANTITIFDLRGITDRMELATIDGVDL